MWNLCKQTAMPNEGQKTNASRRPHCAANGDNKLLVQNGNEDLWGGRGECVECGSGRHVLANGSPQSAHTLQLLIRRIYVCIRLWQDERHCNSTWRFQSLWLCLTLIHWQRFIWSAYAENILRLCPDNESIFKLWLFQTRSWKLWASKCQLA